MTDSSRCRAAFRSGLIVVLGLGLGCGTSEPPPEPARELRIALYDEPFGLDPHTENEFIAFIIASHLYEPLIAFDADLRLRGQLAAGWDNPDSTTWRFRLREGVEFHDGRPLTAEDVAYSLERARSHPRTELASYMVSVESVEVVDELTVEVRTDRPHAVLLNKLAFVLIVPRDAPDTIREPIGTGRYRFTSRASGEPIRLEAFADHWSGPATWSTVKFSGILDDKERAEALLRGDVDLAHLLPSEAVPRVESSSGLQIVAREGISIEYLEMLLTSGPFADARVRRAVSLALDREALVEVLAAGLGTPVWQMVPPHAIGFDPDLPQGPRDLETARALLSEAGFPDGFSASLDYRAGRNLEPLRDQLAEVGIDLALVPREREDLYRRVTSGESEMALIGMVAESGDASDVLDSMGHSADPERGYGDSNVGGYSNPELDHLIELAGVSLDKLDRRRTLQMASRVLATDLPYIPLLVPHEVYGLREDLAWQPRLDGSVFAWEVLPDEPTSSR